MSSAPRSLRVENLDALVFAKRRWWERFGKKKEHGLVTNIQAAEEVIVTHLDLRRSAIHYAGADPARLRVVPPDLPNYLIRPATPADRKICRAIYGKKHSYWLVLTYGHDSDNLLPVIESYEWFREHSPDRVRLLIRDSDFEYSWKIYYKIWRSKYREDIEFLPSITGGDYRQLFACARGILLPSLSTRYPIAMFHAWSAGVPFIHWRRDLLLGAGALVPEPEEWGWGRRCLELVMTPFLASGIVEEGKKRLALLRENGKPSSLT